MARAAPSADVALVLLDGWFRLAKASHHSPPVERWERVTLELAHAPVLFGRINEWSRRSRAHRVIKLCRLCGAAKSCSGSNSPCASPDDDDLAVARMRGFLLTGLPCSNYLDRSYLGSSWLFAGRSSGGLTVPLRV